MSWHEAQEWESGLERDVDLANPIIKGPNFFNDIIVIVMIPLDHDHDYDYDYDYDLFARCGTPS